jgi:superfamily II DNA or RNA helicase
MATYVVDKGVVCVPKQLISHTLWLQIQKELTVESVHRYPMVSRNGKLAQFTEKTYLFDFDDETKIISLPRAYALELPYIPIDFSSLIHLRKKREDEAIPLHMATPLRDVQKSAVEQVIHCIERVYGACLCAPCGFGKTVIALTIICRLGVRALIIVNTDTMVRQWRTRISEHILNIQEGYIEICTIQSFLYTTCPSKIQHTPGIIVVDEAHFLPTRIFSAILVRSSAYLSSCFRLALTATPERQDNQHVWLYHHFGPIAFKGVVPKTDGHVYIIQRKKRYANISSYSNLMSTLASDEMRNRILIEYIRKTIREHRCILVLSLYTAHLISLMNEWTDCTPHTVYTLFGRNRTVPDDGSISRPCVLFATYALAKQGLDCPVLDTLVIALPCKNIVQSVGRIMRSPSDKGLCIIDICDTHPLVRSGQCTRTKYYEHSLEWKLHSISESL